jgi:hypothetical protein
MHQMRISTTQVSSVMLRSKKEWQVNNINLNQPANLYIIKFHILSKIGKQDAHFVRHHSDSQYKYSEADIKGMLGFLVDNIYVVFADNIFQQSVGIPSYGHQMCSLKQNLFSSCYEIKTKN